MTVLKPFRAIRPKPELAQQVVSGEYDYPSLEVAQGQVPKVPKTFVHVLWPEIDLPKSEWENKDRIFRQAADNYQAIWERGALLRDESPGLYIYRQQVNGESQTGIIGGASIDDYFNNVIKIHEQTREHKKNNRIRHIKATNIHAAPVMLFYEPIQKVSRIVEDITEQDPLYSFETRGHPSVNINVHHELWPVPEQQVNSLVHLFEEQVECAYIADGHHRSAAAAEIGQELRDENSAGDGSESYNYFISLFFPTHQIRILPYNRVIKGLNGLSRSQFLKKIREDFDIEKTAKEPLAPDELHHIGLYLEKEWYQLTPKEHLWEEGDPVSQLDVSILQKYLLKPVLDIEDPRTDQRIDFVSGLDGAEGVAYRVDNEDFEVGFALYPVSVKQLMKVADAGKVMPPKSTWIEPKVVSGLVLQQVE